MRKIMVSLLLVMSMALPVFAQESTEAPTQEIATLEATQTADVVTATPSPTAEATAEPSPSPVPVPPIDQTKVVESVLNVVIVLAVGIVAIAFAGIVALLAVLSPAIRAVVLSIIKTLVNEADKATNNPIADAGLAQLRQYIEKLEAELNDLKAQVNQNSSDIAYSARQAGNPPMGTGSQG